MKEIVKIVYYCDFCKKRYLSKYWCEQHEKHCTLNINRDCRMCDYVGSYNKIPELLDSIYQKYNENMVYPTANQIFEMTDYCPQCTLATIRLIQKDKRFEKWRDPEGSEFPWFDWDYKKECEDFWKKYNKENYSNYY